MSDVEVDVVAEPVHVHGFAATSAVPFVLGAPGTVKAIEGVGLWVGYAIEETSGAAVARAVIGDGTENGIVTPFGPFTFTAAQSRDLMFPGHGLLFVRGLVVTSTAGAIAGSLWVVTLTREQAARLIMLRGGHGH